MMRKIGSAAIAVGAFALVTFGGTPARADDGCFYNGTMYSDGASACQAGKLFECDDGEWDAQDKDCQQGNMKMSKACEFGGISYTTGSAKCERGTQYRCEDGAWRQLDAKCPVGDAPAPRVVPSGRSCMIAGATVSNGSTICRSGSTSLCSDGEWVDLGTQCR